MFLLTEEKQNKEHVAETEKTILAGSNGWSRESAADWTEFIESP